MAPVNRVALDIDAERFEELAGYPPEGDDLERVNCDKIEEPGHYACGWCLVHKMPFYSCSCKPNYGEV